MNYVFESPAKLQERLNLSAETLRTYKTVYFSEGIHFIVLPSGHHRYNVDMVLDWLINKDDPSAHQRAIDHFHQALPCNQSMKRRSTLKS